MGRSPAVALRRRLAELRLTLSCTGAAGPAHALAHVSWAGLRNVGAERLACGSGRRGSRQRFPRLCSGSPEPGWSEQDPHVWRDAMSGVIADLRARAGAALGALKAIGFSGQMHGAVLLDASDRPVRPAILHNDGRAIAEAAELARNHPRLAGVVGVKPMPGFTGPKLLWLTRHEPDTGAGSRRCSRPRTICALR